MGFYEGLGGIGNVTTMSATAWQDEQLFRCNRFSEDCSPNRCETMRVLTDIAAWKKSQSAASALRLMSRVWKPTSWVQGAQQDRPKY